MLEKSILCQNTSFARQESGHKNNICCRGYVNVDVTLQGIDSLLKLQFRLHLYRCKYCCVPAHFVLRP